MLMSSNSNLFTIIGELDKTEDSFNTQETGWIIECNRPVTNLQLQDIGYELHQKLLVPSLIVPKENRIIIINSTPLKDEECLQRSLVIIEEELKRIFNKGPWNNGSSQKSNS